MAPSTVLVRIDKKSFPLEGGAFSLANSDILTSFFKLLPFDDFSADLRVDEDWLRMDGVPLNEDVPGELKHNVSLSAIMSPFSRWKLVAVRLGPTLLILANGESAITGDERTLDLSWLDKL